MALSENSRKILDTIDNFSNEIIDFGNKILKCLSLAIRNLIQVMRFVKKT